MILIVNLNLAVDLIVEVNDLRLGHVHRSHSTLRQAGGKGVNVARVLRALGDPCVLSGFLGGEAGEAIAAGLRAEGIPFSCTAIKVESRTCLILNDRSNKQQTVINEPGPQIGKDELMRFTDAYVRLLETSELIILTGSLPPGLPDDTYAKLISIANRSGKRVLLDASSTALRHAIRAEPFMVKVNQVEAGELLERAVTDFESAAEAVSMMIEMGAGNAMITLGAEGAQLAFGGERCRLVPPVVKARNSVGSGDAVMAGIATGIGRGYSTVQLGTLAVAAGAANALHGGGHCTAEEIDRLRPQVSYSILS